MERTATPAWRDGLLGRLDKVTRLAEVGIARRGPRALLRWKPRSVAAFRLTGELAAEGKSFATIIDVGANVGQFSRAALETWPTAQVIAFEALPSAASELRSNLGKNRNLEVHEVAAGASDGTMEFHPHSYTPSSSLLSVPQETQTRYEWAREEAAIRVPLRRLDSVLGNRSLRRPVLLKLDVQGFELEVLAGAEKLLAQADALLVEASFERFYEGQPLFQELNSALELAGWQLARPLDYRREGSRIAEMDCLYLPNDPRVLNPEPRSRRPTNANT
jgi:FkbM family methyltransferase